MSLSKQNAVLIFLAVSMAGQRTMIENEDGIVSIRVYFALVYQGKIKRLFMTVHETEISCCFHETF